MSCSSRAVILILLFCGCILTVSVDSDLFFAAVSATVSATNLMPSASASESVSPSVSASVSLSAARSRVKWSPWPSLTPIVSPLHFPSFSVVPDRIWESAPPATDILPDLEDGWDYENPLSATEAGLPLCPVNTILDGEWYLPAKRYNTSCTIFDGERDDCRTLATNNPHRRNYWNFTDVFYRFRPKDCILNVPRNYHQLRVLLSNRTVVYIGDSVSHNTYVDAICDWQHALRGFTELVAPIVEVKGGYTYEGLNDTGKYIVTECVTITWIPSGAAWDHGRMRLCTMRAGAYHQPAMAVGIEEAVKYFGVGRRDVLVLNHGLHGDPRTVASRVMLAVRQGAKTATQMGEDAPLIVWRETFPQHFGSYDGAYKPELLKYECGGTPSTQSSLNVDTTPIIQNSGMPMLYLWHATASRRFEHHGDMEDGEAFDCTHFCVPSSPLRHATEQLLHHIARLRP